MWDLKASVNILIFWIWQYYLEGRHVCEKILVLNDMN